MGEDIRFLTSGYFMPFADEYVAAAHPPLPLQSKVPRPWALDTYSTVCVFTQRKNAQATPTIIGGMVIALPLA